MNGLDVYQETAVVTQNKGRLIVMLYDGAIKFLRQTVSDMESGNIAGKVEHLGKAREIILELNTILDMEVGGEIAYNLRELYSFMNRHLTQASIQRDPQMIREVIELLEELNQSWKAITS